MVKSRNVRVYEDVTGAEIAGFWQHGDVSVSRFRDWIAQCVVLLEDDTKTTNWGLFQVVDGQVDDENRVVSQTETNEGIMPEGIFVVLSRSTLRPIDCALVPESHMSRALSVNPSGDSAARASSFTRRIRDRDGGCCLSNVTYAALNDSWSTLEAAHIFPHGKLSIWIKKRFHLLITDTNPNIGTYKIDSVQNGILLRSDLHQAFDAFLFAVNPDDNYKVFDFSRGGLYRGFGPMKISAEIGSPNRPLDELFRFHFYQAILKNIKGAADVDEDYDNPEDDWTDPDTLRMDNERLASTPRGKLRLETELATRLGHLVV